MKPAPLCGGYQDTKDCEGSVATQKIPGTIFFNQFVSIFGFALSELYSEGIQVHNVNVHTDRISNPVRRMVCHDRSKEHLFSNLTQSQEASQVHIWGRSASISSRVGFNHTKTPAFEPPL